MKYFAITGVPAVDIYRILRIKNVKLKIKRGSITLRKPNPSELKQLSNLLENKHGTYQVVLSSSQWQKSTDMLKVKTIDHSYLSYLVLANNCAITFLPDNLLLPAPELLLSLLAKELDFYKLFLLALEFAGSYSLQHIEPKLISNYNQILNKRKLVEHSLKLKNKRWAGHKKLNDVANLLQEGSASPMESLLYSLLALPTSLGGLGIKDLKLNYKIELSPEARLIAGQPHVIVDIFHPKSKTAIEYDSRDFHSEVDQSQKDKRRQEALKTDGHKTISVVPQQILDYQTFKACAAEILKATKGRSRVRVKNFEAKQRHCHAQLLMAARKITP